MLGTRRIATVILGYLLNLAQDHKHDNKRQIKRRREKKSIEIMWLCK